MITSYEIASGYAQDDLEKKVNEMISKGWQPYGDLQVSTPVIENSVAPVFCQVMVKTSE
jgi:hypothetical protein